MSYLFFTKTKWPLSANVSYACMDITVSTHTISNSSKITQK